MAEEDDQGATAIDAKLGQIIRLLALGAISRDASMKDNAVLLSSAGLAPKQIAELLGTTPNAVSVALSAARRAKKTKAARPRDQS